MELGLELVPIIGSNFFDAEGELGDDIVDEGVGICLIMALIDFEGSNASSIINGGILVACDRHVVFAFECQKLHIKLNLMTRNLFLVPYGVNFAKASTVRRTTYPIAFEDAVDSSARDLDVMVAGQIPDNANWPQMVALPQMQDLLDDFLRCSVDRVLGDRLPVDQSSFTGVFIERLPAIKNGPANTEISASSNGTTNRFSMLENA